jgi:hypothetical protein
MAPPWLVAFDARCAPACAATLSAVALLLQLARTHKHLLARESERAEQPHSAGALSAPKPRSHVRDHGGRTMFAYELLRTFAALGLVGACAYTTPLHAPEAGLWALNTAVVRVYLRVEV